MPLRSDLILSTTSAGKTKSRRITHINPNLADSVLSDVAAALAGLTDADTYSSYRVDFNEPSASPELSLNKNSIIIPDTITADWEGNGALSVSLQSDIANYAIKGKNVIFSAKNNYSTGVFSTNGLIIIGESDSYDSDSAAFNATAYYLPSPQLQLSAWHFTFDNNGLMGSSANIAAKWKGNGALSVVSEASDFYTYEIQNAAYDATTDLSTANIIFAKSGTLTENYFALPAIHIANTNSFAPQNVIFTLAGTPAFQTLRPTAGDDFIKMYDEEPFFYLHYVPKGGNDTVDNYFCNYSYIQTSVGADSILNEASYCTIRTGSGIDTIISNGSYNYFLPMSGGGEHIQSKGTACSISVNSSSSGNVINCEGNYCSITSTNGLTASKIDVAGDFCTICGSTSNSDTLVINGENYSCVTLNNYNEVTLYGNNSFVSLRGGNKVNLDGNYCTLQSWNGLNLTSWGSHCYFQRISDASTYGGSYIYSGGSYCTIETHLYGCTIVSDGGYAYVKSNSLSSASPNSIYSDFADTIDAKYCSITCGDYTSINGIGSSVRVYNEGDNCTITPKNNWTIDNNRRWVDNLILKLEKSAGNCTVSNTPSNVTVCTTNTTPCVMSTSDGNVVASVQSGKITLYGGADCNVIHKYI